MKEQFKKFLNEEQDPKAIEKISAKLADILMRNEEVGYIGVQKKPAINVFPDSIVLTNRRVIICKPRNLGLSMDFTDYPWTGISGTFVKENILGSEFSFNTSSDLTISMDYLPKIQARKINTFAREQLEAIKESATAPKKEEEASIPTPEPTYKHAPEPVDINEDIEEIDAEEVKDFAGIMNSALRGDNEEPEYREPVNAIENIPELIPPIDEVKPLAREKAGLAGLSKEELFEKLQNYKKLLDNGLILQGEYDNLKKDILQHL